MRFPKYIIDNCNTSKKYETKTLRTQKSTIQRCSQEREDGLSNRIYGDFDKFLECIHIKRKDCSLP